MKLPGVPNPWVILGVVLAFVAVAASSYLKGRVDEENAIMAKQATVKEVAREAADAVANDVATYIANHRGNTQIIHNKAVETVKENTVFAQCLQPEEMQKLIIEARQP